MNFSEEQYKSIYDFYELEPYFFTWCMDNGKELTKEDKLKDFINNYIHEDLYNCEEDEKTLALMQLEVLTYEDAANKILDCDYEVLTNLQAEDLVKEYAESYVEDIIESEIPKHLKRYFDENSWIEDYINEGRGNIIATYDGIEHEEKINGTIYYIYKK